MLNPHFCWLNPAFFCCKAYASPSHPRRSESTRGRPPAGALATMPYMQTYTYTYTCVYIYIYIYLWMDGWMDGWMHGCIYIYNHSKYIFPTVTIFAPRTNRGFRQYKRLSAFFSSTIPRSGFVMPWFSRINSQQMDGKSFATSHATLGIFARSEIRESICQYS